MVRGRDRLCFVLSKGDVNHIVIPVDALAPIDYQRIKAMESKGGHLMQIMRDTTVDNGRNALELYDSIIEYVPNPDAKKEVKEKEVLVEKTTKSTEQTSEPKKRGRGRPKKEVKTED